MPKSLRLKKSDWLKFSDTQIDKFIEDIFNHYRTAGFPYFPVNTLFRQNEYRKLINYNYTKVVDKDNKIIKQTMHGLSLAWSYMPHSWKVVCNDKLTPMDLFNDDDKFKKVIRKRLQMGDNMSDNGIRKTMKLFTGAQSVSNFRPTASSGIYWIFTNYGDVVWDMSAGFGGRLLGSHLHKVHYIGTDPSTKTMNGLIELNGDFNIGAELIKLGSEEFIPDANSLDFCFTSPPYFNTEKYSNENTQSYIKFPTEDLWLNGYLRKTLINVRHGLKQNKYLAINIANTKNMKDVETRIITLAFELGFKFVDLWKLTLSNPTMKNGKASFKYEPIFIFKKI